MKYESELLAEIIANRGHEKSSIHYESECKEAFIEECKGSYPKLCDYEAEWLNYMVENPIGEFPYETITNVTEATVNNVVPFAFKSAILKGNTLVNVINYDDVSLKNATRNDDGTYTLKHAQDVNTSFVIPKTTKKNLFKPNTKYLLAVNIIENNTGTVLGLSAINAPFVLDNKDINFENKLGWQFKIFTSKSDISVDDSGRRVYNYIYFGIWKDGGDLSTSIKFKFMFIEYQEGMENWDIPYFEGMQSVKMPVLTTIGKNLLDVSGLKQENAYIDNTNGNIKSSHGHIAFLDYIAIPNSGNILFFNNSAYSGVYLKLAFYDINKTYISGATLNMGYIKASIPNNAKYCRVSAFNHSNGFDLQLEVGDVKTPYEPYKSNILTVNEDVELRGVGDVRDELDCLTGEVTERIGEIVLDGSQNLQIQFNTNSQQPNTAFVQYVDSRFERGGAISYDLKKADVDLWGNSAYDNQFVFSYSYYNENNKKIQLLIPYSMLKTIDISGVKQFLSENPIKILLPIKESVKKVDLNVVDQDGNTLPKIKPIEGTMNMKTDGQPLKPLLSAEVPVEAITQNLASFIKEE